MIKWCEKLSNKWCEKSSNKWCEKLSKLFSVRILVIFVIFVFVALVVMIYQDRVAYFVNIRNNYTTQSGKEKFDALIEINKTIASILGTFASILGTFATVVGGVFLYLNFSLANKNFQLAIEKNATDKKLTELKLASERFSKATEQLASDKLPARLGAIYALENIAREHEEYHWIVVEVLSAFIRDKKEGAIVISEVSAKSEIEKEALRYLKKEATQYSLEISSDAQAALTVIGRRDVNKDKNRIIDLTRANLRKVHIDNMANFSNVDFSYADLKESTLEGNFSNANFRGVRLDYATLQGANFQKANIFFAHLNGTNLIGTNLTGTNFYYSFLNGACLRDAKLNDANMFEVDLSEAILEDADLTGVTHFLTTNLKFATFHRTIMPDGTLDNSGRIDR